LVLVPILYTGNVLRLAARALYAIGPAQLFKASAATALAVVALNQVYKVYFLIF